MGEVINSILAEGYKPGLPKRSPIALVDGPGIDREICAESRCEGCGHLGMQCRVFTTDDGSGYRSVAVCPECGDEFEF